MVSYEVKCPMEKQKIKKTEGLERALSAIFGAGKTTRKLSQVLDYCLLRAQAGRIGCYCLKTERYMRFQM
jgi:hypothetical protein